MKAGEYNFEMQLNKPVDDMFKDSVHVLLEIEIMQGERKVLKNRQIRYRLNLNDEKIQIIRDNLLKLAYKNYETNNN